jgi:hypothetical protein
MVGDAEECGVDLRAVPHFGVAHGEHVEEEVVEVVCSTRAT